jgi:hypothetical protein
MDVERAVKVATEIIELDLIRDEKWEALLNLAGDDAFKVLRALQNRQLHTATAGFAHTK